MTEIYLTFTQLKVLAINIIKFIHYVALTFYFMLLFVFHFYLLSVIPFTLCKKQRFYHAKNWVKKYPAIVEMHSTIWHYEGQWSG